MTTRARSLLITSLLVLLASVVLAGANCQGPPETRPAEQPAPLLASRSFAARVVQINGGETLERVFVRSSDKNFTALVANLTTACEAMNTERFSNPSVPTLALPTAASAPVCGAPGALTQQVHLCMAYRFLMMAESPTSTQVFGDGTVRPRPPTTTSDDPMTGAPLAFEVPSPTSSDAATLSLLATQFFQAAAIRGAELLDPDACADGTLSGAVGSSPEPGVPGAPPQVTLGFVVASATAEALQGIDDGAEKSRTFVHAAGQAHVASERDERTARTSEWRGAFDSRLEIGNLLVGVSPRFFEPSGVAGEPGTPPAEAAAGELITCAESPSDEGARAAESLLRGVRIPPTTPDSELVGTTVRALQEDFGPSFGSLDPTDPDALAPLGVDRFELRQAARRLRAEAVVLGRPMVPVAPVVVGGVARVAGTASTARSADPAYTLARTEGSSRFDDTDAWIAEGETSADIGLGLVHRPSRAYALRGTIGTKDFVARALERSLSRADLRESADGTPPTITSPPLGIVATATQYVRETVPMRLDVCIGQATPQIGLVRIRLYGSGSDKTRFSLWWGESGLQCGTAGSVEGVACDPDRLRIQAPATMHTDGSDSGLGAEYVEWDVIAASGHVPGLEAGLPTDGRIYVVEQRPDGRRVAIAGVTLEPGPHGDMLCSRRVQLPAGEDVGREVAESLAPSGDGCWAPAQTCAGLPRDLRLPLEDELSEAAEGRDDIESSFFHYLRLARQASNEADTLGEEVIREGLEQDVRAEAARDELESVCGGVVNVGDIPVQPANTCVCPGGDAACPDPGPCGGLECRSGVCTGRSLADYLASDSPALDSVRRCLGGTGELVNAALGSRRLCMWQKRLGDTVLPPCACDAGDTCPEAPAQPGCPAVLDDSAADCSGVWGPLPAGYAPLAPTATIGLGAADRSSATASASCLDLALFRTRDQEAPATDRPIDLELADRVLGQEFLDLEPFRFIGESIGYRPDLYELATLTRGGRQWKSTGAEATGPSAEFPCAPVLPTTDENYPLICAGSPGAGTSLLCGGSCGTAAERLAMNARLANAVYVIKALGGASMDSFQAPTYRNLNTLLHSLLDAAYAGEAPTFAACPPASAPRCDGAILVTCVAGFERRRDCSECRTIGGVAQCVEPPLGLTGGEQAPAWFRAQYGLDGAQVLSTDLDHEARCLFNITFAPPGTPSADFAIAVGDSTCPSLFTRRGVAPRRTPVGNLVELWARGAPGGNTMESFLAATFVQPRGTTSFRDRNFEPGLFERSRSGTLTNAAVLDALELACLATTDEGAACSPDLEGLPPVRSVEDFPRLKRQLNCAADAFDHTLDRLALVDIPKPLADDLRSGAISSTFPSYRGEYGQTVADLRGSLESVTSSTHQVASALRDFGGDLIIARSELRNIELEDDIETWQLIARLSSEVTRCASDAFDLDKLVTSFGATTVATCADAIVQIASAVTIRGIRGDMLSESERQALTRVSMLFATRMDQLSEATRNLSRGYADANRLLARLDGQRSQARRAAARVLLLDRDDVGREYAVNHVMRARFNSTKQRYERAFENAVRYSWIARRAIEQRLAVDMSRMTDDMTLVPAPATWADGLCEMKGIDYSRLRDVGVEADTLETGFIGDYVTLLENFVESYRFDFPFTNASDVSVISLRDEIKRVRRSCDVEGHNLLLYSSDFSHAALAGSPGWTRECTSSGPCLEVSTSAEAPFQLELISSPSDTITAEAQRTLGGAAAYEMRRTSPLVPVEPGTPSPRWLQLVRAGAGELVLSWYERVPLAEGDETGCVEVAEQPAAPRLLAMVDGATEPVVVDAPVYVPLTIGGAQVDRWLDACSWRRAFVRVHSPVEQDLTVAFDVGAAGAVTWSAPQLELLGPDRAFTSALPAPFFPTGPTTSWPVGLCEDSNGDAFRGGAYWTRGCEALCPDGFGEVCSAGTAPSGDIVRCYHETTFNVALDDIERGDLVPTGSLALGNFNYRHDTIAMNVVGVGVRDCSRAPESSACYASGFIPFSLRHSPPFRVRNHVGEVLESPLYTANIEQAKALSAERYVTNPISSADRVLLGDYTRRELRGRPLEGHYRLRVWDAPGFDWNRVEDIQLILNYRYWTRFE